MFMGLGRRPIGPYKPGAWYYNPNVPKFYYNPEKAKALLAAAGWQPDPEGILGKDGRPFEFTILTNQGNESGCAPPRSSSGRLRRSASW